MMALLMKYWWLAIVILAILVIAFMFLITYINLPNSKKAKKVKEWLLFAVVQAEKELGSGTGALKLRFVYDMFITKFPLLVALIPFSTFSSFVDEALDKFKKLLATTPELQAYVANQGALEEMKEAVAEIADQNKEEV